jgi:hypothetical protein
MEAKKWYQSKVVLANIVCGLALVVGQFIPGVSEFVQAHFTAVGDAWAIVNVALRVIGSNVSL